MITDDDRSFGDLVMDAISAREYFIKMNWECSKGATRQKYLRHYVPALEDVIDTRRAIRVSVDTERKQLYYILTALRK